MRKGIAILAGSIIVMAPACSREPGSENRLGREADFSVEYRLVTRMPTCLGNHRVRIAASGEVYSATNATDCPAGERWSTPFPSDPARRLGGSELGALRHDIEATGVLAMADSTDAGTATDGVIEEIEISRGRDRTTIKAVNVSSGPFVLARAAILRAAGEER